MPAATSAGAPAKSAAAPSSAMPLTWIIVETAPHLAEDEDTMPHGAHILLRGDDPPLPSRLTLNKRVAHNDTATVNILAANSSGRLLICIDKDGDGDGDDVDYVLGDVATRLSTRLPSFTGPRAYRTPHAAPRLAAGITSGHPRRGAGLIANPRRDGDYFVAELHPRGRDCTHYKALLCYSTDDADWMLKRFASSPHHPPWECNGGVLAHEGKLWWVDNRHGILTCDVAMDSPDLRYVALPQSEDDSDHIRHRCIKFSEGQLRCAEIDSSGEPRIVIWTMSSDPEGSLWKLELELGFTTLWADASYNAAGLPKKLPSTIALLHPSNFGILYLFYDMRLVSIDMRAAKNRVLGVHSYNTHSVFAWELPPHLLSVLPDTPTVVASKPTECIICSGRVTGSNVCCDTCSCRIGLLLNKLKSSSMGACMIESICLRCGSTVGCKRDACAGLSLPVSRRGGDWIAWVTGKERWAMLFNGVQVDKICTVGMPLLLHPPVGTRCKVCKDVMGEYADTLYKSCEFCSINCWKEGDADSQTWASDLVSIKVSCAAGSKDSFCTTCSKSFSEDADSYAHKKHVWVKLLLDQGRGCVEISNKHPLASLVSKIKPINEEDADPSASSTLLLPLHSRGPQRCVRCNTCLVEGGGRSCCLICALSVPSLQPRSIQLRNRVVSMKI